MKNKLDTAKAAAMVVLLSLGACKERGEPAGQALGRTQVSVVVLHPQSVPLSAELPGRVAASLEAEVRPQVTGIIQKRLFLEGSDVREGDALYQIDPMPYQAAYDSAAAALQKAESAVPSAQAKADRYSELVKRNAVSQQEYDDAQDIFAQARANVRAARASLQAAKISLDYTTIRAPISGRIDKSSLMAGALVTAGQATALTTIRQIDPVNVDLTQSSASFLDMREALEAGRMRAASGDVPVKLELENGTIYPLRGRLEFSESSVSPATGTYVLRAVLRNPARLLLPGMYVRAVVEEGTVSHAFLIPQRAVSRDLRGEATALVVREGKVVRLTLAEPRQHGNDWIVDSAVADGDQVIVEGGQRVREGDAVVARRVEIDTATGAIRPVAPLAGVREAGTPAPGHPLLSRDRQPNRS